MKALILVDIQNDFLPGGALAVPDGDQVIPTVNKLQLAFPLVVATQDWHPANHGSFAASHPGKKVFEQIALNGLPQTLWPVHCVQSTPGAALAANLKQERIAKIFQKGTHPSIDSYSGLFDNGHRKSTGLGEWLKAKGVTEVFVCGLATDYCVKFTALDAMQFGFKTYLIEDASRGVNIQPDDVTNAVAEMKRVGVVVVQSTDILKADEPFSFQKPMSAIAVSIQQRISGGLWGALTGDALGVPVEFLNRYDVQSDPVTGMRGNGTHHQPKGTWSDDGSLIVCTVDSLLNEEFDTQDIGRRFVGWMNEGLWTAHGEVFDMGMATVGALTRIATGTPAEQAGGRTEDSNGNGSLMRIIPVALRFANDPIESFCRRLERASAVTHGHDRAKMACVLYGLVVRELLLGKNPQASLDSARVEFTNLYKNAGEFERFRHHLNDDFSSLPEGEIVSTGYVLHTLHASLWCLLTTQNYRECVLKAVNLGGDTDTTGCVAGGLAGVAYGLPSIPTDWLQQLARKGDLDCLFHEFADLCSTAGNGIGRNDGGQ